MGNRGRTAKQPLEDRALKAAAQFMGEELLPFLGIEGTMKRIAPTEQVHMEIRDLTKMPEYGEKRKGILGTGRYGADAGGFICTGNEISDARGIDEGKGGNQNDNTGRNDKAGWNRGRNRKGNAGTGRVLSGAWRAFQ